MHIEIMDIAGRLDLFFHLVVGVHDGAVALFGIVVFPSYNEGQMRVIIDVVHRLEVEDILIVV